MSFKKHKIKGRHKVRKPRGYIFVRYHEHPFAHTTGYMYLHRLKMENKLGRYLRKGEIVHHIDGNPRNNHSSNLELTTVIDHGRHHAGGRAEVYNKVCPICEEEFSTKREYAKYCSANCSSFAARIVERPSKEELERFVWKYPRVRLAVKFSVSDVLVNKWCKALGIKCPPRGYWAKKEREKRDKEKRPSKKKLQQLAWKYSVARLALVLGVGECTIRRWYKEKDIQKPPHGYWERSENKKGTKAGVRSSVGP